MLPKHMPVLEGKDAEEFIEQDKKPLNEKERKYLERCDKIFKKTPFK